MKNLKELTEALNSISADTISKLIGKVETSSGGCISKIDVIQLKFSALGYNHMNKTVTLLAFPPSDNCCHLLDYVDMDGAVLLAEDLADGVKVHHGIATFPDRPGNGVVLTGN